MRFRPQKTHETASVPVVVPLEHLAGEDRGQAGSKAVNLGMMIRAGLPAPRGFCVTTAAFGLWLDACATAQPSLDGLDRLDATQTKETEQTAAGLRQKLATAPLPDSVERVLVAAWEQHGPEMAWAVRSIATQEDLRTPPSPDSMTAFSTSAVARRFSMQCENAGSRCSRIGPSFTG